MMFRGNFEHTIDQKGRLSIPSRFRELLREHYEEKFIVTRSENCLEAYPEAEWVKLEKKISQLPQLDKNAKAVMRFLVSSAIECPVDKQGRILIPQYLRNHAGLEKDVVLAGMIDKVEIWAKDRWEKEMSETSEQFGELGGTLGI
jgi:MraZ protein